MQSGSQLRALTRLAWNRLRARPGDGDDLAHVPRRKAATERHGISVNPRRVAAYLAATGGETPPSSAAPDAALPPVYPAVWETALFLDLLSELRAALPPGGLLHCGGERVQIRPLRVGDLVRCRVELDRAEPCSRGTRLVLTSRNWNGAGQLCSQSETTILIRTVADPDERAEPSPGGAAGQRDGTTEAPGDGWREIANLAIRSNHGRRYARISGDYNPIHLWSWTARPFGFRRPILHGFCTEAMVAHALIRSQWGGDPAALRRLQTRLCAPLHLPARVRLLAAEEASGGRFRVVREGSDPAVCAEGSFVGG